MANLTPELAQKPLAIVVPHHNLVAEQRAELFSAAAVRTQPQTIIVLSPNHFSTGKAGILTTDKTWTLNNSTNTIEPDQSLIQTLIEANVVTIDSSVFNNEHGVSNLLRDIRNYFPEAQLVPIIFRDTTSADAVEQLMATLNTACADSCGVIASVDMSHYLPAAVANIHDQTTLRVLTEQDQNAVWQIEVDSQPSLFALMEWAKLESLPEFVQFNHTNSGTLVGDTEGETTSHIFGYYQAKTATEKPTNSNDFIEPAMTFTFAGDAMLGREIGYQFQNDNYKELFSNLGNRVFWGTDISWLNLEGPVSDQTITQERQPDNLSFLFSRESIAALKYLKVTTVGLANNHTANHGQSGLVTTRQLLDEAAIDWVGDPAGINDTSVKRYDRGGIIISLIAVNVFDGDISGLTDLIKTESTAGRFVIVLPHWGNEYQTTHSSKQEQLATDWVTTGANLIIGMHPHVVQDAQVITATNGAKTLVLYSLGNFVFDQSFSQETQQGLLVAGSISDSQLQVVLQPLVSNHLKPELARGATKQIIIDRICSNIQAYCKAGVVTVPR